MAARAPGTYGVGMNPSHRVVVVGGGVAGLEAIIALRQLAGMRVAVTLLTPEPEFRFRALSVEDPFARPLARSYDVAAICADEGAALRLGRLEAVDSDGRAVTAADGARLEYDSLLVAVGARQVTVFPEAIVFRGLQDTEAMHGLLQDVEGGYTTRIAFVVPPGVSWPLPLYELALMTAERAYSLNLELELTIVTPEPEPLGIFGRIAAEHVGRLLAEQGIGLHTDCQVRAVEAGVVLAAPGDVEIRAQRVVALPRLEGPAVAGLAQDPHGFLPVDEHARVRGTADAFGAGDGTTVPIKQGAVAAQQAGTAARAIAARAGAEVEQRPFRPTLRAQLLTGSRSTYLRNAVAGEGDEASVASDAPLWWPPTKVAAPYLSRNLERLDSPA